MLCKASHSPEEVYSTLKSIKGLGFTSQKYYIFTLTHLIKMESQIIYYGSVYF